MKNLLLLVVCLVSALSMSAQLEDYTNAPNITGTDINGNPYDMYAALDSGYTVIVDVMATWCPPCWSWHEAGYFEDLYETYGPLGTNELRVIMVEADSRTPEDLLTRVANGGSAATTSLGDWTAGTKYPILNVDAVNNDYDIAYFPTIFAVSPNRMVFEIGRSTDLTVYQRYAQEAPGLATSTPDGLLLGFQGSVECGADVDGIVRFQNYSTDTLQEVSLVATANGEQLGTNTITQALAPYEIVDISAGIIPAAALSDEALEVTFAYILDGDVTADNELTTTIGVNTVVDNEVTLEFITDAYPVETSWSLTDAEGNEVLSASYTGPASGGGADANKVFTYTFNPGSVDAECYEMTVSDSYGDGMGYLQAGTDPRPGYRILDSEGEVVVDVNLYDDMVFESSSSTGFRAGALSSSVEAPIAKSIAIFPNPAIAGSTLQVQFGELVSGADISARLFNSLGQVVREYPAQASIGTLSYDLPQTVTGLFTLELRTQEGVSTVQVLVQ